VGEITVRAGRTRNIVLIADDNDFVRFLIKKWVGDSVEIVEIAHGMKVFEAYAQYKPDIMFLDIHLPGKNGKDILKEVQDHDPQSFVIMVSADSKRENVIDTMTNGAKAFLTKPLNRQTLDRYVAMCPTMAPSSFATM
jgi:DNA-binding NtrC family response regulator